MTFSKNWCQGFCTRCGTSCAEHSENYYQLKEEFNSLKKQIEVLEFQIKLEDILKKKEQEIFSLLRNS